MRRSCSVSIQLLLFFLTGWATGGFDPILSNVGLRVSVEFGDLEQVQKIAECRCADFLQDDVELRTSGKGNLLHLAVQGQYPKIVEIVLSSGINPNLYSSTGYQAIHYAAARSSAPIVELLLEYGADPNTPADNDGGNSPLHYAAWYDQTPVIEVLLEAGVDIDQPSLEKTTALGYALIYGRVNAARILFEAGADPKAKQGMPCSSLSEWICPCRADYSCEQFTCSKKDVQVLKELADEACASKESNDEKSSKPKEKKTIKESNDKKSSKPEEKKTIKESGALSTSKTEEEQPAEESGVPSPIDKLKWLLETESDK